MSDVVSVTPPHPMQPFVTCERTGVRRFKPNRIILWHLEHDLLPLTQVLYPGISAAAGMGAAVIPGVTHEDRLQLLQLTGPSLSLYAKEYGIVTESDLKAAELAAKRKRRPKRHPMQPVIIVVADDERGAHVRFKANTIVSWLVDQDYIDLNRCARLPFESEDREQLAQLIGYSVSGYADLSYVTNRSFNKAWRARAALIGEDK
jgi:hypothetical protein